MERGRQRRKGAGDEAEETSQQQTQQRAPERRAAERSEPKRRQRGQKASQRTKAPKEVSSTHRARAQAQ